MSSNSIERGSAQKPTMCLRHTFDQIENPRSRRPPRHLLHRFVLDAITRQRAVQPVVHEPTEDRRGIGPGDGVVSVENDVKHIIMIAADEACDLAEREEELDYTARIRPAVHVVPDEQELGCGIRLAHGRDEHLQWSQHAVNVANNPSHSICIVTPRSDWRYNPIRHERSNNTSMQADRTRLTGSIPTPSPSASSKSPDGPLAAAERSPKRFHSRITTKRSRS